MAETENPRPVHDDWQRTFRAFLDNETRPAGPRAGDVRRVRPARPRASRTRPAVP